MIGKRPHEIFPPDILVQKYFDLVL